MSIKLDISSIHLTRAAPIIINSFDVATKKAKVLMMGLVEQEFMIQEGTDEEVISSIGTNLLLATSGEVQPNPGASSKGKASSATAGCLDRKALNGVCNKACFS